jgi:hypothetical protein
VCACVRVLIAVLSATRCTDLPLLAVTCLHATACVMSRSHLCAGKGDGAAAAAALLGGARTPLRNNFVQVRWGCARVHCESVCASIQPS